ncbi:MAG: hypothetical protein KF845_01075 [Cyclobacteriaceae bacterium]|nr:hypothetical protein [Cyclobacteriaceae bacterium]
MNRIFLFSALALLIAFEGCKPVQKTTSSTQGGRYHEDLSALRPTKEEPVTIDTVTENGSTRNPNVYVEPKFTVNKQVDTVLDSIDRLNLNRRAVDGFTIQIYYGTKREDALNTKKDATIRIPEMEAEVQYLQPNFRVKVGRYFNRLQAQKDYETIKQAFPNAILIPDKISLN